MFFLLLKICWYEHQKIRLSKSYSTEKTVLQNNEKQPSWSGCPKFFTTLILLERIFLNIFTNRLLRLIRLCKTDLLMPITHIEIFWKHLNFFYRKRKVQEKFQTGRHLFWKWANLSRKIRQNFGIFKRATFKATIRS